MLLFMLCKIIHDMKFNLFLTLDIKEQELWTDFIEVISQEATMHSKTNCNETLSKLLAYEVDDVPSVM